MCSGRCWRQRRRKRSSLLISYSQAHKSEYVLLKKWIQAFDKSCNIKLEPFLFVDTGRGLRTKDVINKGEIILSIPECAMITPNTVLKSKTGDILKQFKVKLSPQRLLSIFLVFESEKDKDSFWYPYLQSLPASFSTPLYFNIQELRRLPKNIYTRACKEQKRVQDIYQDIHSVLTGFDPTFDFFTYDKFRWAWCVVNTRSVYVKTEASPYVSLLEREKDVALAPFLDLLNHSSFAKTEAKLNPVSGRFEIITCNKCERYSQVFIHYNPYSNENLLMEYGFTLPDNPYNIYEFTTDDVQNLVTKFNLLHWDRKSAIFEENDLNKDLNCCTDGISWKLQTLLRIAVMSWDELCSWKSVYKGEVSPENENMAVKLATSLINTAVAENKKYLVVQNGSMSEHEKLALTVAKDNITILTQCLCVLSKHNKL